MNSKYDYDPTSHKDESVDIVANMLEIVVPILRSDVALTPGAFPWCESVQCPVPSSITTRFPVLYLLSWFPGMLFRKDMAIVHEFTKGYLQRPFEYALRKVVMLSFRSLIGCTR